MSTRQHDIKSKEGLLGSKSEGCSGFRSFCVIFHLIPHPGNECHRVWPVFSPGNQLIQVQVFLNLSNGFLLIRCDRYKTTRDNMISPDKRRSQGTVTRMSQTGDKKRGLCRVDRWKRGIFCHIVPYITIIEVSVLMHNTRPVCFAPKALPRLNLKPNLNPKIDTKFER